MEPTWVPDNISKTDPKRDGSKSTVWLQEVLFLDFLFMSKNMIFRIPNFSFKKHDFSESCWHCRKTLLLEGPGAILDA